MAWNVKKSVAVSTTSPSMTEKIEKLEIRLEWISCIWYPVTFKNQIEALLDLRSEVNVMSPTFTSQLGLKVWKINVGAQKIDSTTLETYEMVISIFSVSNKDGSKRFL